MTSTRRTFLQLASATGAVLAVGLRLDGAGPAPEPPFQPNVWLKVARDGRVAITVGKSEMGQGVRTALPMIAAEELGIEWSMVDLVQAEPGADFQRLGTGGSFSIQSLWGPLRQAAAAAREMLIAAAAGQWGVEPSACKAAKGAVQHSASGRSLSYGRLTAAAAKLPVPKDPPLKNAAEYQRIGHPTLRYDGPRLLDGSAPFAADIRLPCMKFAVLARCPVFGGKAASWDAARPRPCPGSAP